MANKVIFRHNYRGVTAFCRKSGKQIRIDYWINFDVPGKMELIGDVPVRGAKEPPSLKSIEKFIDGMFEEAAND